MSMDKRVERLRKKIENKKEFTAEKWVELQREFGFQSINQ